MSDILDRIRSVETAPLHGTEAWVELWEVLQDARAEITRLRAEVERLHDDLRFWQSRVSGETVAFIEFDADAKEEK